MSGFKEYTGIPDGAFRGLRGMTTQSFTESNVKNGFQWELGLYNPALASLAEVDIIVVTGSVPLLIKGRALRFDGLGIFTSNFENVSYTGGTPLPFFNLNNRNPKTPEVVILAGATVVDEGTKMSADKYFLGSNAVGNSVTSSEGFEADGEEFLFDANTNYLFRITSIDGSDAQRLFSYVTWYEGGTDIPV
jgi:hypothetical protein